MVPPTMRLLLLAVLAACAPTGTTTTTASSTTSSTAAATDAPTSSGTTDACEGSGECDSEGLCVAAYTPSADPRNPGQRGPAGCVAADECIPALDLARFCFDHQGCCESLRCRTVDGVCEPADLGLTGGETTTSSSTTSSTSDTGDTTDTTSDTGDTTTGTEG